jgi:predicted dehydrogenase
MDKVRWGVLGAARIALNRVIPAMQMSELSEIAGIASRDRSRAEEAARQFGIRKTYGSYEEMLEDPEIEAVYNPLPNHLHVPVSILAAQAGKHVLCEKPLGLDAAEAQKLLAARDRYGVEIGEAFMVQVHPQWVRTVELVRSGRIGALRFAMGSFGYYNDDRNNVRNIREYGGGGLMDIGCYPIKTSRMVFGEEPVRVAATLTRDPETGVDILASAILEYSAGNAIFSCGTRVVGNQSMQFFGTSGRIEIEVPFNPRSGGTSRIRIDDGRDPFGSGVTVEEFAPCDQYTLQGDAFSCAVRHGAPAPVPLEDSIKNMAVIDAVFRAAESGGWERPGAVSTAEQGG